MMDTLLPSVPIEQAWEPLPRESWDRECARHLLRRTGFSALPDDVESVLAEGPAQAVKRLFRPVEPMPLPAGVAQLQEDAGELARQLRRASPEERRRLRTALRDRSRLAFEEFAIRWLARAADPRFSAYEKLVLFLQDVFVVAVAKVRNPALLFTHQQILREHATGSYPDLCKAVSRSPAMIQYLDLQQNKAGHPNENFARELFELFTLGEGHYSEEDIKQAARAFTGYRQRAGRFVFARRQFDPGSKHVFGERGDFEGDDVIDLIFRQPAAARFLPGELLRFYLTERPLPPEYLEAIGRHWRDDGFETGRLLQRVFTSRLFFDPVFRGESIKSPIHFYLGLLQDLGLQVAPFPRFTLNFLRSMGQPYYNPPNVRGWVGGQLWINSSTLAARRQVVGFLLAPLDESRLNADEQAALRDARSNGTLRLTLDDEGLDRLADGSPEAVARRWVEQFLPGPDATPASTLAASLAAVRRRPARELRRLLALLLEAPQYQLC